MSAFMKPGARALSILGAAALMAAFAAPVWALGPDTPPPPSCKRGEVYSTKLKKCVKQKAATEDDKTEYAYALAKAGRYQEALDLLSALNEPATARALNYRGYATRKLGRVEEGIGYYLRSVSLDPHYARVREYLGEAYVQQSRPDLARQQLAAIESICGRVCEEYEDLSQAIEGGTAEE
jgi:tetratricopeptide (TPR) repeat protein